MMACCGGALAGVLIAVLILAIGVQLAAIVAIGVALLAIVVGFLDYSRRHG